jgi:hypothetical protein
VISSTWTPLHEFNLWVENYNSTIELGLNSVFMYYCSSYSHQIDGLIHSLVFLLQGDSDDEDFKIRPEDNLLICGRVKKDHNNLDVFGKFWLNFRF